MLHFAPHCHIARPSPCSAILSRQSKGCTNLVQRRRQPLIVSAAKRRNPTNFKKSAFQKRKKNDNSDQSGTGSRRDNDSESSLRGLLSALKISKKQGSGSSFDRKQQFQKDNNKKVYNSSYLDKDSNQDDTWERAPGPSSSSSSSRGFSSSLPRQEQQRQYRASSQYRNDVDYTMSTDAIIMPAASEGSLSDSEDDALLPLSELSDTEIAEIMGQDTSAPDPLAGVDSDVERDLTHALSCFEFPLDPFQVKAVRRVIAGRSVTVCAPTGAGKTAIAEASAIHVLRNGGKVIYTTPLKALSNQKLREMRQRFGADAVGLQTGDASINADASIVVMTTEILRNILYRTEDDQRVESGTGATTGTAAPFAIQKGPSIMSAEERLADVDLVVFDECHYLGDPGRGSVWEESIIAMPKHVTILAMSATVRNPHDLSGWISAVHRECDTITTSFRPVPLQWLYCISTGLKDAPMMTRKESTKSSFSFGKNSNNNTAISSVVGGESPTVVVKMIPLLDTRGKSINPELLPPAARRRLLAESMAATWSAVGQEDSRWDSLGDDRVPSRQEFPRTRTLEELMRFVSDDTYEDNVAEGSSSLWHSLPRWQRIPAIEDVIKELQINTMLPAIWFIFSRKDCDAAVARLQSAGARLTTDDERAIILSAVHELREDQPEAVKEGAVEALASGLASHHAGCLPAWKSLIEKLFQKGCIKVVFATETLAAGINMPAKTTLLSALSRRRDGGISALTHNELLQMAGRAGRRGYDTLGHCIVVQSRWEDPEFAYDILRKGPEPLRSQFTTNYGMALNLLWSRSMEEARNFLDRSYSKYLGGDGAQRIEKEIERLETKAKLVMEEVARRMPRSQATTGAPSLDGDSAHCAADEEASESVEDVWTKYQKLQGRRREEKRAARMLRAQLAEERGFIADATLAQCGLPCVVGLDLSGWNIDDTPYRLTALAVKRLDMSGGQNIEASAGYEGAMYLCLGSDNMVYAVGAKHVCAVLDGHDGSENDNGTHVDHDDDIRANGAEGSKDKVKNSKGSYKYTYDPVATATAAEVVINHASTLRRSSWQELAGGALSAEGTGLTSAAVIAQLPLPHLLRPIQPSPEGMDALRGQRVRVNGVKSDLEALRNDKDFAKTSKRYSRAAGRAGVLMDRAAALRGELEERMNGGWKEFESIVGVLEAAGAFEPTDYSSARFIGGLRGQQEREPDAASSTSDIAAGPMQLTEEKRRRAFTALGKVARELRGANELWLAVALTHPALQLLPPAQLAGVVSSLVAQEAFNRANVTVAYPPSAAVTAAVEALEPARAELSALQIRAGLDVPLGVDLRLAGVVEAWASGVGWAEVTADCGLDDGDVARLLMRTVDTLRQAAFCEHLPLKSVARKAASSMDRKPISDLVA